MRDKKTGEPLRAIWRISSIQGMLVSEFTRHKACDLILNELGIKCDPSELTRTGKFTKEAKIILISNELHNKSIRP
jgi:hypothetical protein